MLPRIVDELPPRLELPTHGLFKNLEGRRIGRLLVYQYIGKINNKHSYACICDCGKKYIIGNSTSLSNGLKSCGCYQLQRIKEANNGNTRGKINKKSLERKIEKLKNIHPDYIVVDPMEGLVMENWHFVCNKCKQSFSARYDNIVGSGSRKPQQPCKCGYRGGFNFKEKSYFYILQLSESFIKFGITNDTDRRWKQLEKEYGTNELLLCFNFKPGVEVEIIEKLIKLIFPISDSVKNMFPNKKEIRDISEYHKMIQMLMYLWNKSEDDLNSMHKTIRKLGGLR